MGLNGFADELDSCFRSCPGVVRVHTIAACGSNPRTWMKLPPYGSARTHCGFLRIESTDERGGVEVDRDIYGVPAGNKPGSHVVPKIEDLVASIQPDILIIQNGNNFFDLFEGGQADREKSQAQIRTYMAPMRQWLASSAPSVKRLFWVTPPEAGNVSEEVQSVVFETIRDEVEPRGVVIDSRRITSYPYPAQSADKMHFWGDEAFAWGRDAFRLIAMELGRNGLKGSGSERVAEIRRAIPVEEESGELLVRVRVEKIAPIPSPETFAPYGDLMVACLYKVLKVKEGRYDEKHMVILHPAYINHQRQDLSTLKRRRTFEFRVRELDDTSLWATVRREDEVAPLDLLPHLVVTDELRHPNYQGSGGAQ